MASKEIAVDTTTLNNDITKMNNAYNNAKKQLEDVFNQMAQLDAMWDGEANEQFNIQFKNDYENASSLLNTVKSLIDCMEYAKNQYNQCETEVQSLISSINV